MKIKSFILKYASKIMFYDVNIACYHTPQVKYLLVYLLHDLSRKSFHLLILPLKR